MTPRERLRVHCARPPRSVLYDEDAGLLLDLPSGKTLALPEAEIQALDERADVRTTLPLLGLLLKDGRAFALADVGIAFAPLFTNTGALVELPAAVCWSDFRTMVAQLKLELYGASGPGAETVRVLMCCLAIIDGARAIGFEVGPEELELEWHLKELERRAPG
jgi:hypothetical protein